MIPKTATSEDPFDAWVRSKKATATQIDVVEDDPFRQYTAKKKEQSNPFGQKLPVPDFQFTSESVSESTEPVTEPTVESPTGFLEKDIEQTQLFSSGDVPAFDPRSLAEPVTPSLPSAKKAVNKEVVLSDVNELGKYINGRFSSIDSEIKALEEVKANELYNIKITGVYHFTPDNAYDAAGRQIKEKKDYLNKLRNSAAAQAASLILPKYLENPTTFNPKELGRELVRASSPDLESKFQLVENEGKPIPGIQSADLEKTGIDLMKSYVGDYKFPPKEQIDAANASLAEMDSRLAANPTDISLKNRADALRKELEEVNNIQKMKQQISVYEKDFEEKNYELTWSTVKDKLGAYFHARDDSGVFGYNTEKLMQAVNDPAVGLTAGERAVALNYGIPLESKLLGTDIPGSGLVRSFKNAVEQSVTGTWKTIASESNKRLGVNLGRTEADQASELLNEETGGSRFRSVGDNPRATSELSALRAKETSGQQLNDNEKSRKVELQKYVDVRTNWDKVKDLTGNMTGQVAAIAVVAKGVGGIGNVASKVGTSLGATASGLTSSTIGSVLSNEFGGLFISSYLFAKDRYDKQAIDLMPGEDQAAARDSYSSLMSGFEAATEMIFRDTKVLDGFMGKLSPSLAKVTKNYINGSITSQAARDEINSFISKYVKSAGKEFFTSIGQNATEESAIDILQGVTNAGFGIEDWDLYKTGTKAVDTFVSTAISSGIIGSMAGHGAYRKANNQSRFMKATVADMAVNPAKYLRSVEELQSAGEISQQQANDKIKIIKSSSKFLGELPATREVPVVDNDGNEVVVSKKFDYPEAISYVLHRLNEGILTEKLGATTDPIEQSVLKKQISQSEKIRKGIYEGKIGVTPNIDPVSNNPEEAQELGILSAEDTDASDLIGTPFKKETTEAGVAEVSVNEKEQAAIEGLQNKDFTNSPVKPYTDVIQNPDASIADKKEALKGLSDQLTAKGTEITVGEALGKDADLIYGLGYEPVVESEAIQSVTAPVQEDIISVGELIDKPVTRNGERGTIFQDGQTLIFKPEGKNVEFELGNVDQLKNESIKDFGIEQESSVVSVDDTGALNVRGATFQNKYSDPFQAINRNKDGEILSVTLDTGDGKKRTFRGQVAEDLAYEITLQQISKNNEQTAVENFINEDEQSREEIINEQPTEIAQEEPVANTEPVQRKKIERKPRKKSVKEDTAAHPEQSTEKAAPAEEVIELTDKEKLASEKSLPAYRAKYPKATQEEYQANRVSGNLKKERIKKAENKPTISKEQQPIVDSNSEGNRPPIVEGNNIKYAKREDGSLKNKNEYTPEEWKHYTDSVIKQKLHGNKPTISKEPAIAKGEPTTTQSDEESVPKLTKEAADLLSKIDEGGSIPAFVTKNLEKIASDNGIEVTGKTSAQDIVNALRQKENITAKKSKSEPKTKEDPKKKSPRKNKLTSIEDVENELRDLFAMDRMVSFDFDKVNIKSENGVLDTEEYAKKISSIFDGGTPKNTTTNSFYFTIENDDKQYRIRVSDHPSKFEEKNQLYDKKFDLTGNFINDYVRISKEIFGKEITLFNLGDSVTHFQLGNGVVTEVSPRYVGIKFDSGKEGRYNLDFSKITNNSFSNTDLESAAISVSEQSLDKISSISVYGNTNTIDQYLEKAKAVLSQLYPDATITTYYTAEEYYDKEGRPVGSAGVFHPQEQRLALNLELIAEHGAENTIFHEVIHPIVNEAILSKEGALDDVFEQLKALKDIPGMDAVHEHIQAYAGRGINIQKVEGITEFLTQVADGKIDLSGVPEKTSSKVIDLINKIFEALGISLRVSTATDLKRLSDAIKTSFDNADASPVSELIGRRKSSTGTESVDAILPEEQEQRVRDIISRSEGIPQDKLKEAIKKYTVWSDEKIDSFFGKTTGITHAQTQETASEFSFEGYEPAPETFDEWDKEAMSLIESGYDIEGLIKRLEEGKLPTNIEQRIMGFYLATQEAAVEKDPSKENLETLMRAVHASDVGGGRLVGQSLAARKGFRVRDNSLAGFFIGDEEANEAPLTDNQRKEVVDEYNKIQDAQRLYEEKIISLEKENARLRAEKELSKERKSSTKSKKTHSEYVSERKEILTSIKDKLKAARTGESGLTAVPVPYAKELFVIAPDVMKLTRSLLSEGVSKLDDIIREIHSSIKDSIDGLTEKDIHDIIAGDYNTPRPTRREINKSIVDLRTEAKLINRLSELNEGSVPKTEKAERERNREIESLKKQIKNHDITKLSEVKKRINKQISDLENDLKTGNYQEPETTDTRLPVKLDKEAIELKDKLIKLRQQRAERLAKLKYENRTLRKRAVDRTLEIMNVPRTIMASMDYSAPLRQAVIPTVSHPIMAAKAAAEMFRQSISQKRFDRWFFDLQQTPRYELMKRVKLYVADPHDPRLSTKEEAFMNNLAEKIPFLGRLIKGSERAYVGFLNKMRVDLFNRLADGFENEGLTYENNPELYDATARMVNNFTGRGGLGPIESTAPVLNSIFFSPRLIASRFNILGLSDFFTFGKGFYVNLPPKLRLAALGDLLKFVGVGTTLLGMLSLWAMGGDDDDKDKIQVEVDARSSDFGKIRSGNTRWDIWGGFQPYVRLIAQLFTGERKATSSGQISSVNKFGQDKGTLLARFVRGKLAPVPATALNLLTGRNIVGEKVTVKSEAMAHLQPLIVSDMKDAIKDRGVGALFTHGLPSVFGVGVQTYLPRGYDNVDTKAPVYKELYEKGLNLTTPEQSEEMDDKIYDKFTKRQRVLFKEKWDNVIKYGAYINEEGNPTIDIDRGVSIKPFNELSNTELTTLMKSISNSATRTTKKELDIKPLKK